MPDDVQPVDIARFVAGNFNVLAAAAQESDIVQTVSLHGILILDDVEAVFAEHGSAEQRLDNVYHGDIQRSHLQILVQPDVFGDRMVVRFEFFALFQSLVLVNKGARRLVAVVGDLEIEFAGTQPDVRN